MAMAKASMTNMWGNTLASPSDGGRLDILVRQELVLHMVDPARPHVVRVVELKEGSRWSRSVTVPLCHLAEPDLLEMYVIASILNRPDVDLTSYRKIARAVASSIYGLVGEQEQGFNVGIELLVTKTEVVRGPRKNWALLSKKYLPAHLKGTPILFDGPLGASRKAEKKQIGFSWKKKLLGVLLGVGSLEECLWRMLIDFVSEIDLARTIL